MKSLISVASLLTFSLSMDAQIVASLNRLRDGPIEIRVRNNSTVSATAFVVKVNHVSDSAAGDSPLIVYLNPDPIYVDTAIDTTTLPLRPNEEQILRPQLRSRGRKPASLGGKQIARQDPLGRVILHFDAVDLSEHTITSAGVFADGATTGDPALLTHLMLRRSNMLLGVEMTLETLSDAGRRNVPPDQLIRQFKKLADSVRRGYLPSEQRVGLTLYLSMIGKLMNLPDPKDGSPFPPSEFVEQETATLRKQRVALIESQPSLFTLADTSQF